MAASYQHVSGLAELAKKLQELAPKLAQKHLKGAMVAGAVPIRDTARELAPVWDGKLSSGMAPPGTLEKSIILKAIPERSGDLKQTVFVLVRHGRKFKKVFKKKKGVIQPSVNMDAWYWRFPEFGTAKMTAKPYMRPAFENRKNDAIEAIKVALAIGLQDVVKS